MIGREQLGLRVRERHALLAAIVDLLKSDRRVVAAWLGGSLGRGNADSLSDIDIYVVIAEPYARFVINTTREFVSRVEGILLTETDAANAPPDGAYLLTLFHGETGPHQVDWYWHTGRIEMIPPRVQILFNTAELPVESMQFPSMVSFDFENEIARFWALAAITCKKIARRQPWSAIALLGKLRFLLDTISWHLGASELEPFHADTRSDPPPTDADGQLSALNTLISEITALTPALKEAGLADPHLHLHLHPLAMAKELAPLMTLSRILTEDAN